MNPDTGKTAGTTDQKHWYCFSFYDQYPGSSAQASVYIGFDLPGISKPRILQAKAGAGVRADAVLIACSYLGQMSRDDFETMI